MEDYRGCLIRAQSEQATSSAWLPVALVFVPDYSVLEEHRLRAKDDHLCSSKADADKYASSMATAWIDRRLGS